MAGTTPPPDINERDYFMDAVKMEQARRRRWHKVFDAWRTDLSQLIDMTRLRGDDILYRHDVSVLISQASGMCYVPVDPVTARDWLVASIVALLDGQRPPAVPTSTAKPKRKPEKCQCCGVGVPMVCNDCHHKATIK